MIKKTSRKSNARHEVRKEERRNESLKCRKKGWREKVNRMEQGKKFDKDLSDEIEEMKKTWQ